MTAAPASRATLDPALAAHLDTLSGDLNAITEPHQSAGRQLAGWLRARHRPGVALPVVVVCTGNSRRSMLGAMMGNAAASALGLPEVRFTSAGTAPSAFNPRTIAALQAIGFAIEPTGDEAPRGAENLPNPCYHVRWGNREGQELVEFSKALGDPALPPSGFVAIMVCDEADAGCPFVPGAAARFSSPFPDPKAADGTPGEAARYAATRDAVGRLMLAVLAEVQKGG
jgi:arsenate reductase (thioredoxin)